MGAVLDTARAYLAAGLSVIPVRADGTKAPAESGWRAYAAERPAAEQLDHWFGNGHTGRYGIGIPGGPASGNLAVLDFETDAAFVGWLKSLSAAAAARSRACPLARTPGGGAHLYARLPDSVPGLVLARRLDAGRPKVLVEVRGNGHQVVAPGSPGSCHPSGREYEWLRRAWLDGEPFKEVPWETWLEWLERAAALDELPPADAPAAPDTRSRIPRTGTSPGDDFNHRGTWQETGLFDGGDGWKWARSFGDDRGFITRPGKAHGTSATLGLVTSRANGWPLFYCFTTSDAAFRSGETIDRFGMYARLRHKGDFRAAARALGEAGYGDQGKYSSARIGPAAGTTPGAPGPDAPRTDAQKSAEPKYRFIDHAEFRVADFRVQWLVDWFLAKGQPGVVAGPSKGMKTSILVDLAVSLATATPHLGKWTVPERSKVAIVSGESGGFTLQETARRICAAKGLPFEAPDGWLKWEFTLPTFADLIDTADFAARLGDLGCGVVIIDPFYLCLGAIDAKNMFEMGQALRAVAEQLLVKHGVTPVIAHHANRGLVMGEPMELQHLAYSGLEQFARQYVFLNRRSAYANDGRHDLWYRYGGSAGHTGLYVVDIDEGVLGPDTPVRGWDVTVSTQGEARVVDQRVQREEVRHLATTQRELDDREVLNAIDAEWAALNRAPTREGVRDRCGLSVQRVSAALGRLIDRDAIEEVDTTRRNNDRGGARTYRGYRRVTGGLT